MSQNAPMRPGHAGIPQRRLGVTPPTTQTLADSALGVMLGTAAAARPARAFKSYGKPFSAGAVPPWEWVQRWRNHHTAPIVMLVVAAEPISAALMPAVPGTPQTKRSRAGSHSWRFRRAVRSHAGE